MNSGRKIELLVIPDLFPKYEGDVQGVFMLDYLEAVKPYCNCTVLFMRLTGDAKGLKKEERDGVTIYRYCVTDRKVPAFLKPLYYWKWFRKGFAIGKMFAKTGLIHAHGSILSGNLAVRIAEKLGVPFVITEHVGPFSLVSGNARNLKWAKRAMERADAVLAVSEHLKKEILEAGIHPKKVVVTYNPVNTELFSPSPDKKIKRNILFASRLDAFKGALRSLKAFHLIAAKYPEWNFTIVGEGEEFAALQEYAAAHKELQSRVVLKGHKRKDELPSEMQHADFLVAPSLHESFGLVIAEALSCGIPVIAPDRTGPSEFVTEQCGLVVNPESVEAIATAMEGMINSLHQYDPVELRAHIVENFGFENFGKKLANVYRSVFKLRIN